MKGLKKIRGFLLPMFECEKGLYIKVTKDMHSQLKNSNTGLYDILCNLEVVKSRKSYDLLLWRKK